MKCCQQRQSTQYILKWLTCAPSSENPNQCNLFFFSILFLQYSKLCCGKKCNKRIDDFDKVSHFAFQDTFFYFLKFPFTKNKFPLRVHVCTCTRLVQNHKISNAVMKFDMSL